MTGGRRSLPVTASVTSPGHRFPEGVPPNARSALILAGTAVAAVALWLMMKVLKWTLWLLIVAIVLGGLAWAGWELLR